MKITLRDITNSKLDVREYMEYDPERKRITVLAEYFDKVIINTSDLKEATKSTKADPYCDLDRLRTSILIERVELGLEELWNEPKKQWVDIRLERPLLEKLLLLLNDEFNEKEV